MDRKLLIVVDMQKDFIDGSLGTKEAQMIVPKVIEKIRNFDGDVIYTKDTHDENYLSTQEGRNLPIEHCIRSTPGWEIQDGILNAGEPKHPIRIYDKHIFGCEELAMDIRHSIQPANGAISGNGIADGQGLEIEIIGLCTDICVVSNALLLKTFLPEAKITVDSNCCAGVTIESHEAALVTMKMCQINIV